jgi:PBP1b-binding outer membrane lipoprotein LpoB
MRKGFIILLMIILVALFLAGCVKKSIVTEEQEKTTTTEISEITGDIAKADTTNSELTDTVIDSDLNSLDQTLENW